MTIEFPCPRCGRPMRTPDSAAGKKGQCPQCKAVTVIPQPPIRQGNTASAAPRPTRSAAPKTQPAQKIDFPCAKCGRPVRTSTALAGKKGKCPGCGAIFIIPGSQPETKAGRTAPVAATTAAATTTTAPAVTESKAPTKVKRSPQKAAATAADAKESPHGSGQPPAAVGPIEFPCEFCGGAVRSPASMAGKKGRCPNCTAVVLIPPESVSMGTQARKPAPQTASTDFDLDLAPLDDDADLQPSDDSLPLTPIEALDESTPVVPSAGLTPLDDNSGLTPIADDGMSLTPLGASESGLVPINAASGLVPIADDPLADIYSSTSPATSDNPFAGSSGVAAPLRTVAANPYQSPAMGTSGRGPRRSGRPSRSTVMAPAIAMIVVSSLTIIAVVLLLIADLLGLGFGGMQRAASNGAGTYAATYLISRIVATIIILLIHTVIIRGAMGMMNFCGHSQAWTAAILSLLPCNVCWLGLPIGIWAVVVLCLSNVKAEFD